MPVACMAYSALTPPLTAALPCRAIAVFWRRSRQAAGERASSGGRTSNARGSGVHVHACAAVLYIILCYVRGQWNCAVRARHGGVCAVRLQVLQCDTAPPRFRRRSVTRMRHCVRGCAGDSHWRVSRRGKRITNKFNDPRTPVVKSNSDGRRGTPRRACRNSCAVETVLGAFTVER